MLSVLDRIGIAGLLLFLPPTVWGEQITLSAEDIEVENTSLQSSITQRASAYIRGIPPCVPCSEKDTEDPAKMMAPTLTVNGSTRSAVTVRHSYTDGSETNISDLQGKISFVSLSLSSDEAPEYVAAQMSYWVKIDGTIRVPRFSDNTSYVMGI